MLFLAPNENNIVIIIFWWVNSAPQIVQQDPELSFLSQLFQRHVDQRVDVFFRQLEPNRPVSLLLWIAAGLYAGVYTRPLTTVLPS